MKKIFLLSSFVGAAFLSQAQVTVTPEIGFNLNKFYGFFYDGVKNEQQTQVYEWQGSPRAGFAFDIPMGTNGFSIEPGVYYSSRKCKSIGIDNDERKDVVTSIFNFIEIPINLKYTWEFGQYKGKLFVHAAPFAAYAFSGMIKQSKTTKQPEFFKEDTEEKMMFGKTLREFKNLDYGVQVGMGYQFPFGLQTRISYSHSFSNLSNEQNVVLNPGSNVNISVGYVLGRKIPGRFY